MLTKKEGYIIQLLIKYQGQFITSKALAAHLACSDRTVRTYYKSLIDKLKAYPGITILAKRGQGYQLQIKDQESYIRFLQENHINDHQANYQATVDINDRHNYLLNKLLFEQNEIYFDDLVDELFVSRSTLSSDFRKIRKELAPYHLKIKSKANKGVYVTGNERDKRRFIMDYFIRSDFMTSMHSYVDNELLNEKIPFEELTLIVLDECREGHLKLSDFVIQNLVIHIALAIRRITEGFQLTMVPDRTDVDSLPEREVASKILKRVAKVTHIDFPLQEIDYITLHLVSKGHGCSHGLGKDSLTKIRLELLQSLALFCPHLINDFQFVEGLVTHLATTLIRLRSQVILENPLTQDICQNYPDMYRLAEKTMSEMPIFRQFDLSADEIAYIALHYMAAAERLKEQQKYSILVICATGYGSSQMLKSRIENELGHLVHIVDVIGYYDISDDKLEGIDFIISSIDLSNLIFTIPVFTVSVFLTNSEVSEIRRGISYLRQSVSKLEYKESKLDITAVFDDYFSEQAFYLNNTANKESLLEKMIASISEGEDSSFSQKLRKLIQQREQMSSIMFSSSIAVPHPIQALANKHRIALALIKDGLYWDDEYPKVKFVFLTSMSKYGNEGLPELVSYIVTLAEQPAVQEKLLSCQSFEEFRDLFLQLKEVGDKYG